MPPRPKKPKPNSYLKEGRLISPPRLTKADIERERQEQEEKERLKKAEVEGIITFDELYSGEYYRKQRVENHRRMLLKAKRKFRRMKANEEKERLVQMLVNFYNYVYR